MSRNRLSRRTLIKGASAASVAALAAPALVPASVLGAEAPSNKINIAHIGCGGRHRALRNGFIGLKDCRIVAACDPIQQKREATAKWVDERYKSTGCKAYNDFRDALADKDIDAVVIATQDSWHVPAALLAARAGKDMYVEKPMGVSIEQDHALRKAVKRYGNVFQYGTQQRSIGHVRKGCELVLNGRIGKLQRVDVVAPGGKAGGSTEEIPIPEGLDYDMYIGPAPMTPYTKSRCTTAGSWYIYDFALGFIAGWGAHPLDVMVWGLGDKSDAIPVEIEGTGVIPSEGLFDTITTWDLKGKFASGVDFTLKTGGDKTSFIGDKGTVHISRGKWSTEPASLMEEMIGPGEIHLPASTNHGQNFLDAIKTRGTAVAPIDSSVYSDTVSHLGDIAIRTGRKIKWDVKKETIVGDATAAKMMTRPMRAPWKL